MKIILHDNGRHILRFDKGEEVLGTLKKFLAGQSITASVFTGIGACNIAELAMYDPKAKDYHRRQFEEDLELLSLIGNSASKDGAVFLHAHATLSKGDFSAIGGHAVKLIVSATCEIFLTVLEGRIERKHDSNTNLNLLI